jgi:signal transduction histidine kinase
MYKKIFFILCTLNMMTSFSQKKSSLLMLNDSIEHYIRYRNDQKAKEFIDEMALLKFKNKNEKYLLDKNKYYYHFILKQNDSCSKILTKINIYSKELDKVNLTNYYTNLAYFNKTINQLDLSILHYIKALSIIENDLNKHTQKISIYAGLSALYSQIHNIEKELFYIQLYLKESYKGSDNNRIGYALNMLAVFYDKNNQPKKALFNFRKALNFMDRIETRNTIYQNIGAIHLNYYNNIDSTKYFFNKATNKFTSKRILAYIHRDLSVIENRKGNFLNENKELQTALKNIQLDPFLELEIKLYKDLSKNNKILKNYKESLRYLEKYDSLNEIIKNQSQIEKVEEIEIKYQSEKKEKLNLQLKIEKEKTNNFLIASLLFIFLGSIITVLIFKNSNKKRKVAEQQKELETQKNLTLLKEQEITTINAMVDGQEKERKQIAEDLHDNLGSVLATLKLHFEKLKINCEKKLIDPEILFNKTENLIDEAYIKVRSIAHAKNSGVIANEGLLVAIKIMADKISSADKIKIAVIDFGLNKRLENSLEITVFRIIQELITNIIKHADAKNATINVSLYDKNLNIIIEDDGKGFDFKKVNFKKGMGINSIKTRVAHLEGTFEIDSTLEKGSSIIINIPIS